MQTLRGKIKDLIIEEAIETDKVEFTARFETYTLKQLKELSLTEIGILSILSKSTFTLESLKNFLNLDLQVETDLKSLFHKGYISHTIIED